MYDRGRLAPQTQGLGAAPSPESVSTAAFGATPITFGSAPGVATAASALPARDAALLAGDDRAR